MHTGHGTSGEGWGRRVFFLKLALLVIFFYLNSHGAVHRVELLIIQERYVTLTAFLLVWVMCVGSLFVVAFHHNFWIRFFWATIFTIASFFSYIYITVSSTSLSVFDAISLWSVRHEIGRAAANYASVLPIASLVSMLGFIAITLKPRRFYGRIDRIIFWLGWAPTVPIAIIASIILAFQGGGSQSLPQHFSILSISGVAAYKLVTMGERQRIPVFWTPNVEQARVIILLVDESIRADYINWDDGNPFTPKLAAHKGEIISFGMAASGGNCSHYSNALLRLSATHDNINYSINHYPTIWNFAQRAGYRTIYIDGQSGRNKNAGKLQNFMTEQEARAIDVFYEFDADIPMHELDFEVLKIIDQEIKKPGKTFIYANKNGAHFPYDSAYPIEETRFTPTETDKPNETLAKINSYRNAIYWSVDTFFDEAIRKWNLDEAVAIYTSDHGQNLTSGRLTHCSTDNPDPREALVPLLAITGIEPLADALRYGAQQNMNASSHFAIMPTVLDFMGYDKCDIMILYGSSLLEPITYSPAFSYGDIFGLFADQAARQEIDLTGVYLKPVEVDLYTRK
jgi:glucan phosphoethanolaminetransferase (alkaline phosphatase superfamily)